MNVDFALVMVVLVFVSGVIWLADVVFFAPRRDPGAKLPVMTDYARSLFPIFLIVLLLRSFLVEPFRIPSGSMMPTLLIGDYILVNKYVYGFRLPVLNTKVIRLGAPERGDVVVFRYPEDPSTPFIKRVIGLPGDRIAYHDKALWINDDRISQTRLGPYEGVGAGTSMTGAALIDEDLYDVKHAILVEPERPSLETETVVPDGNYFVMGDNRDNSKDSRYWGTVPDDHLIGKAFMIWMNWDSQNGGIDWQRLGRSIR